MAGPEARQSTQPLADVAREPRPGNSRRTRVPRPVALGVAAVLAVPGAITLSGCGGRSTPRPTVTETVRTTVTVDRPAETQTLTSSSTSEAPIGSATPTSTETSPSTTLPESGLEVPISQLTTDIAGFVVKRVADPQYANTGKVTEMNSANGTPQTEYTLQINTGTAGGDHYIVYNVKVLLDSPKDAPDPSSATSVKISREHGRVPYDTAPDEGAWFELQQAVDHAGNKTPDIWQIRWNPYDSKQALVTHENGQPLNEEAKKTYDKKLLQMRALFGATSKGVYRDRK